MTVKSETKSRLIDLVQAILTTLFLGNSITSYLDHNTIPRKVKFKEN